VAALARAGLLGLTVEQRFGGGGRCDAEAAEIVSRLSAVCPATSAVLHGHYAAVALLGAGCCPWLRTEIAIGHHLVTLALDDHPAWPAAAEVQHGVVRLTARKRGVVAAGEADSYLWSSPAPEGGNEAATALWLVPAGAPGLHVPAGPDPTGTATRTVAAEPVRVPSTALLRVLPAPPATRPEELLPLG
jgi:alkylation response protein AidB-like acyl-CoA dehydrogenase